MFQCQGPKKWITLDGPVRVPVELLDEVSADEVAGPVHAVGAVDSHERIWNEVSVNSNQQYFLLLEGTWSIWIVQIGCLNKDVWDMSDI